MNSMVIVILTLFTFGSVFLFEVTKCLVDKYTCIPCHEIGNIHIYCCPFVNYFTSLCRPGMF